MKIDNENLRHLLKKVEARAASALAGQPHDEAECAKGLMRAVKEIAEMVGAVLLMAGFVALAAVYAMATPDQMSGECDRAVAAMEEAGR